MALAAAMENRPDSSALLTWARSAGDLACSNAWLARSRDSYALVQLVDRPGVVGLRGLEVDVEVAEVVGERVQVLLGGRLDLGELVVLRMLRRSDRFSAPA